MALTSIISWLTAVILTLVLRHAVVELVKLTRRIADGRNIDTNVPRDRKLRFSGRDLRTDSVVTDAELLGRPSTVLLMSPGSAHSQSFQVEFLALVRLAGRRSLGRLWILCQGSCRMCDAAMSPLQRHRELQPRIVYEPEGNAGSVCPTNDEVATIIFTDSNGSVVTCGYTPSEFRRFKNSRIGGV